jgi:putative cell wall-binding protein
MRKKWFGILATTFLLSSSFTGNAFAAEREMVKPSLFNLQEEEPIDAGEEVPPYIEQEPNNSFVVANDITNEYEVTGSLTVSDEDYFKVEIPAKSYFSIYGNSENEGDQVAGELYDSNFNLINDGGIVDSGTFYDERVITEPGTYYIKIKDNTNNANVENYNFSVFFAPGDVFRMGGADRYETAVKVASEGWSMGDYVEEIILATGEDFPDALAAGPLAAHLHAPILLTKRNELPASVKDFINDFGVVRVTIVGGSGVVSQGIQDYLDKTLEVSRIAGQDRFETAAKIAASVAPSNKFQAFVVNGRNFPDALSAAPMAAALGAPILLTDAKTMPAVTANAVKQYEEKYVIGGSGVVSDAILNSLGATRIGGLNRYETSVAVAEYFEAYNSYGAFVTTGEKFPDALAASALAGLYGQPIILTTPNTLHPTAQEYFESNELLWYTIIGGTGAVSSKIEQDLWSLVQ